MRSYTFAWYEDGDPPQIIPETAKKIEDMSAEELQHALDTGTFLPPGNEGDSIQSCEEQMKIVRDLKLRGEWY